MVDDSNKHNEYGFSLASMVLLDLVVEVYDLVNTPMDKAEREVKHVDQHQNLAWVDLRICLQVPQLSVDPQ